MSRTLKFNKMKQPITYPRYFHATDMDNEGDDRRFLVGDYERTYLCSKNERNENTLDRIWKNEHWVGLCPISRNNFLVLTKNSKNKDDATYREGDLPLEQYNIHDLLG